MYRQNGDSTGTRVEPTACVCFLFFLLLFIFEHLFYLRYLFYAIFIVNHFNFFRFAHACMLFICVFTHFTEPIKALDPSSSFYD